MVCIGVRFLSPLGPHRRILNVAPGTHHAISVIEGLAVGGVHFALVGHHPIAAFAALRPAPFSVNESFRIQVQLSADVNADFFVGMPVTFAAVGSVPEPGSAHECLMPSCRIASRIAAIDIASLASYVPVLPPNRGMSVFPL